MDLSNFNIDWNKVEEVSFEPVPAGTYAAKIVNSKISPTKKKDGTKLDLTIELLGQYKGRKVFDNMMLKHPNPKAVQIGLGKMKSIAKALGLDLDALQDTSEFHGKPLGVKIKIESSDQYGDKNRVVSFKEFSEEYLENADTTTEEITVDETEVVEDTTDSNGTEEIVVENEVSPADIQAMKKAELLAFVKADTELNSLIELKGKKLSEVKDAVINEMFGTTTDNEEDLIIED